MSYDFSQIDSKMQDISNWLISEFARIRTGRATPSILDSVKVDSYGNKVSLNQVASVSIEDAKTLLVTPWDKNMTKPIESAITSSDLGISVSTADSSVRVIFPDLTSEVRERLIKLTKSKLEEAKISIRKEREKVVSDIKKIASEDEQKRHIQSLEKKVKEGIEKLEALSKDKEKELSI